MMSPTTSSKCKFWISFKTKYISVFLAYEFSGFNISHCGGFLCSTFGPVEDVRIPCQQKRMFGFVTFVNADTVKMILAKGNPHFVCGARVLVKPYREKSKLVER